MSRTARALVFALCLGVFTPTLAVYSSLQATVSGCSGQNLVVSVHNPNGSAESARVQVTLQLASGDTVTLVSSNFTVAAGATTSVTLAASAIVVEIEDSPEPIGAIQ